MPTLSQMQYALALEQQGNFIKAAKTCFVTQPTLSMQLQKLEDELEVILFDRSRQPIVPTEAGIAVLEQFRAVMREHDKILQVLNTFKGKVAGSYKLAAIPTVAPYILPRFMTSFLELYTDVSLTVIEMQTHDIIAQLKDNSIDGAILATPIKDPVITEHKIFDEPLLLYHSKGMRVEDEQGQITLESLPHDKMILMSEGHCLRTQTLDLCQLAKASSDQTGIQVQASSMQTLLKLVDAGQYVTLIPALAATELSAKQIKTQLKSFSQLRPYREMSLVTYHNQAKYAISQAVLATVNKVLPTTIAEFGASSEEKHLLSPTH